MSLNINKILKEFMIKLNNLDIDKYLLVYLIINPFLNIIQSFFPGFIELIPNNIIFIIRIFIILIPIYQCRRNINYLTIGIILFLVFAILFSGLVFNNWHMLIEMFCTGEWITIFFLFIYFSVQDNYEYLYKTIIFIAFINVFLLIIAVMIGFYGYWSEFRYMDFSHSIIIYWIFLLLEAFVQKNKFTIAYVIVTGIIIALISNRAILITIFISVVIFSNLYLEKATKKKFNIFLIGLLTFILIFFNQIMGICIKILSIFNINSYSLISFQLGDFFSSSSRLDIWSKCIDLILKNPIFGNGIGSDRIQLGGIGVYAHNIFIELWVDFGLIIGTIIIFLLIYSIYKYFMTSSKIQIYLILPYFITSFSILLLSKSIYNLPEFWICVALICNSFVKKKYSINLLRRKH